MTNLDHGKFTRVTTLFHSLLAMDVFLLFFTGYAVMFNDELWWLVQLMGGNVGVLAVHRIAGLGLIILTVFWMTLMIVTSTGRGNFKAILPSMDDVNAFVQDIRFALGQADERHPNARQFAGYTADEVPLLTYVGKGVVFIFAVELTLLMITGLLIWSKTGIAQLFQSKAAAMAFVVFHGLLGVIMLMGVMFHIFEHTAHPAFYPIELKVFIPERLIPHYHVDEEHEGTGIERLELASSWNWVANLLGVLTVIGIVSVLVASIFDEGYPVPRELTIGGGPTNLLLTIGINIGILVLFIGMGISVYGNVMRKRWERQQRERERQRATTDGGTDAPVGRERGDD